MALWRSIFICISPPPLCFCFLCLWATAKVNQSQVEVTDARNTLKMCQLKLEVANNRVGKLQGQLKQAIRASR